MTTFTELGLAAPLLTALEAEGYSTPTPIQAAAIPAVMQGKDLLGIAQTGTGKTAAFALPILHRLAANPRPSPRKGCRVLVLSPTRELATQIGDSFRAYGRQLNLNVAVVFGGVAHRPQIQALARGLDVLVATPGRLIDHMMERNADIRSTEILVLDEADQMLDLGFIKPIRRIIGELSQRRQTLLFSATMPDEIAGLVREFMNDPVRVAVTPVASTAERVSQRVIHVPSPVKRDLLAELLADEAMARTLVFTRTKRGADKVARHLEAAGIASAAIHGNKSQKQREVALHEFRKGSIRTLVATDIAARGIDIDGVTHVVNYELPEVPEAYVHRIGRTARAGASGSAISLCDREERDLLFRIEKLIKQRIPSETRTGASVTPAAVVVQVSGEAEASAPSSHDRGPRRDRRDGSDRHRGRQGQAPRGERQSGENSRNGQAHARGDRQEGQRSGQNQRRPDHQGRPAARSEHSARDHGGDRAGGQRRHAQSSGRREINLEFPDFGAPLVRPTGNGNGRPQREDRGGEHRARDRRGSEGRSSDGHRDGRHRANGASDGRKQGYGGYRGRSGGSGQRPH